MANEDQTIRATKLKEAFVRAMTTAGDNEFAQDYSENKDAVETKLDAITVGIVEAFDILMGKV